jgi:ubiquinol-cytochrome c reductase cytochrome c1 subunit
VKLLRYSIIFLVISLASFLVSSLVFAAESEIKLDKANINLNDKEAIKRGAILFTQYCLSCHSAAYMRYSRIGEDLGMTNEQVTKELIRTGAKVGDTMTVTMDPKDAKRWFGNPPPDLSVIARARGVDWLYTYLRSFYKDDSRPWGVNNAVFKDVAMPDVLWELQGLQAANKEKIVDKDGTEREVITGFKLIEKGKLTPKQYDAAVHDLVTFLAYLGEPSKLQRLALGKWVILFLAIFLVIVYLLKKEYWKDIH